MKESTDNVGSMFVIVCSYQYILYIVLLLFVRFLINSKSTLVLIVAFYVVSFLIELLFKDKDFLERTNNYHSLT